MGQCSTSWATLARQSLFFMRSYIVVFLYVICHFSLAVLEIFSLFLVVGSLTTIYLGGFFVFVLLVVHWASKICKFPSYIPFGKISAIISSDIFSAPFSLTSDYRTLIITITHKFRPLILYHIWLLSFLIISPPPVIYIR